MGLAIQGVVGLAVGYQTVASPHTTLQETWQTLLNIKTHLEAVNPKRRQRIEAAAQMSQCRSLEDIENEFEEYVLSCIRLTFASFVTDLNVSKSVGRAR